MRRPQPAEISPGLGGPPTSVDILIVSYNTRELLAECLESIESHRPPEERVKLGIKIFDNASSDGTADMVAERFPTVELTRSTTNEGFARASNTLAQASRADYLLLLNPDTVWITDVIEPLLDALRTDTSAVIAGPRLILPDGEVQLSSQHTPSLSYEFALPLRGTRLGRVGSAWDAARIIERARQEHLRESRTPRHTDFLWATCWLIAREEVRRHGLFDPGFPLYDEDLDLCTRLRRAGRTIIYRPDVELIHIGGASSTSAAKFKLMRAARTHYYRVHRGRVAAMAYRHAVPWAWRVRLSPRPRTPSMA
jgi:N-acetylglucosaminyl-diphospho-decaprenol L-rhamnosyltransferase